MRVFSVFTETKESNKITDTKFGSQTDSSMLENFISHFDSFYTSNVKQSPCEWILVLGFHFTRFAIFHSIH